DRLDEIAKTLRDLADQNAGLRKELADLKAAQDALRAAQENQGKQIAAIPPPPPPPQVPSADQIATAAANEIDKGREAARFQLLGVNVGADNHGDITFTGRARYFNTVGERFGIQAQGEYMYWKTQREGQFDIGLVDRVTKRFQAGLFGSFKGVTIS